MMKNLGKYSIILCLISLLQGCEVLSMISSIMPSSGISADLQIGDDKNTLSKNNSSIGDIEVEDEGTLTLNTNTSDSHIDSAEEVIVNNAGPWWHYLLMGSLLFVMTPQDIYRKIKNANSQ